MQGIIFAGCSGTRLYPITVYCVNKQATVIHSQQTNDFCLLSTFIIKRLEYLIIFISQDLTKFGVIK